MEYSAALPAEEHSDPRSLPIIATTGVHNRNSAPSDQRTTDEITVPVQPSTDDASGGSRDGPIQIEVSPVTKCGCFSPDEAHFENFKTFQEKVNEALQKLPPQQTQYDKVRVLMIYWEESDIPDLSEHAQELGNLLKDDYGFEVDSHVIKNGESQKNGTIHLEFRDKLTSTIKSISDEEKNNLLILYYGGHGIQVGEKNKPLQRAWAPKAKSETYLEWSDFRSDLRISAYCDILFLFDCCYALAMMDTNETYQRRCEIFCASGANDRASAMRNSSFTKAITKELSDRKDSKGIGVLWFKTLMTSTEMADKHKLSPAPHWHRYSDSLHQTSIFLESKKLPITKDAMTRNDKDSAVSVGDSIAELDSLSNTRVLVKLRLVNPAELLLEEDWMKWFQQRPSNVAGTEIAIVKKISCHGLFKSDSSLLLLSMPAWVWENMPADPACESIGIVRSDNLLPLQIAPGIGMVTEKAQHVPDLDEREREAAQRDMDLAGGMSAIAEKTGLAETNEHAKRDWKLSVRSKRPQKPSKTTPRREQVIIPGVILIIPVHEKRRGDIPDTLFPALVGRSMWGLGDENW